ncbi:MAG: GFA family protein [Alphaproteobacteria bacterium]|nr:GFA family protein [Alphaproteobacteria bacterium]
MTTRTARCCCGALSATAEGEPFVVSLCNCIECQRRTGSPFGVGAYYEADKVSFSGPSSMYERHVEDRWLRFHFCPACGSTVYWQAQNHNGRWGIAVGAFADPHFPRPARSVFERSRHDWLSAPNDIPGFTAGSNSTPSR